METTLVPAESVTQLKIAEGQDRRTDIEGKQALVAALLKEVGCQGLLVLEPENFAWLTSGGTARGVMDPNEFPGLYLSPDQRWILCSNVDSQRLFDEELDGLGFQIKQWPWQWGRSQLLADLCQGKKIACDRPLDSCHSVADKLGRLRRVLTPYEQLCLRSLGQVVSHALEATCRTMVPNQSEREIAGQISHRLLHRGVMPVILSVAAEGRSRRYKQCGFTETPVRRSCLMSVTARKYGLHVTASRTLAFGPADAALHQEHAAACKIAATLIAATWPDGGPREILSLGRRVYLVSGFEHEWLACPPGHVTGRTPVELPLLPQTEDLFQTGWAITWRTSVGAACSCDTFLITDKGPEVVTPTEAWPMKRIRLQGAEFFCPDLLERSFPEEKGPVE